HGLWVAQQSGPQNFAFDFHYIKAWRGEGDSHDLKALGALQLRDGEGLCFRRGGGAENRLAPVLPGSCAYFVEPEQCLGRLVRRDLEYHALHFRSEVSI